MPSATRLSTRALTRSGFVLLALSFGCSSRTDDSAGSAGASSVAGTSSAGASGSGVGGSAAGGVAGVAGMQNTGGSVAGSGGSEAGAPSLGGAGGSSGAAGTGGAGGAGGAAAQARDLIVYDDSNGRLLHLNGAAPALNWTSVSGEGRDIQLVGSGKVMLGKADGWDEYRVSDGVKAGGQHGFPGTEDAYRLADGNTLLASVSGTNIVLKTVNGAGQVQGSIMYPGFSYVRLVRPTVTGSYMVTADTVVFEGNAQGKVIWQVSPQGGKHVWKAVRLADGNTAISTGYGATLLIYDSAGKLLKTIGGAAQPNAAQIAPWFYADFHVMPNGNYFLVNSQADRTMDSSVQLLEYDTAGTLVWQQKQPMGVRTLEEALVIDGLDAAKLYVEPQGRLVPVP